MCQNSVRVAETGRGGLTRCGQARPGIVGVRHSGGTARQCRQRSLGSRRREPAGQLAPEALSLTAARDLRCLNTSVMCDCTMAPTLPPLLVLTLL